MRRWAVITLIFAVLLGLPGCRWITGSKDPERYEAKKLAGQEAEDIFKLLLEEDIDGLTALFAEDAVKGHDIRKEWKAFFDQIDGKLVSYSGISFPGEGMEVDKDGTICDSHLSVNSGDVTTDNGTVYKNFGYYQTRIDTRDRTLEGINVFTMQDPGSGEYISVGGLP